MYSEKNEIVKHLLAEVEKAIETLQDRNADVHSVDDYLTSPEGTKNLAASCMLLEAIGESFKKVDKITQGTLLSQYPQIPWKAIMGIRDHIAHGYFDIDADVIYDSVQNDLAPLDAVVKDMTNQL